MQERGTSVRADWNLEALQAEAYRLTEEFQIAAAATEATELEKIHAETANLIVAIAEKQAGLIDARVAESRLTDLRRFGERLIKTFEEDVSSSLSMAQAGSEGALIENLRGEALQKMNLQVKTLIDSLKENSWQAWNQACEELIALREGRALSNSNGEA